MQPLLAFAVMTVSCNLIILSAIAAGRQRSARGRRAFLTGEVALLCFGVYAGVWLTDAIAAELGWALSHKDPRYLVAVIPLVVAALLGFVLARFEYRIASRQQNFAEDWRRSVWIGRGGIRRLDGTDPRDPAS